MMFLLVTPSVSVARNVDTDKTKMSGLSSRTCQPRHRKTKPGDCVLGPLVLLHPKRPTRQPEQRRSGP
jgi:hypothetical protein